MDAAGPDPSRQDLAGSLRAHLLQVVQGVSPAEGLEELDQTEESVMIILPRQRTTLDRIVEMATISPEEWTQDNEDEIQELRHSLRTDGEVGLRLFNMLGDHF